MELDEECNSKDILIIRFFGRGYSLSLLAGFPCWDRRFQNRYVMVFRNDVGFSPEGWDASNTSTNPGIAWSADGIRWEVQPEPWKAAEKIVDSSPKIRQWGS